MAPVDFKFTIEKLESAKEWTRWKMSISLLLKTHGLLSHVTGEKTLPKAADGYNDDAALQEAITKFELADAKALLFISQALNDKNFDYIKTCSTAKDAYEKLVAIYDKSSTHRLDRLWTEFFHLEWKQGENIASFISRSQNIFIEANDELKRILKCVVPGQMLLFRIISMLPQEYIAFKTVWDGIPLQDRSIELLTERLCAFEQQIEQQQCESTGTALQIQARRQAPLPNCAKNDANTRNFRGNNSKLKKWSNQNKRPVNNITCFECGLSGHKRINCPQNRSKTSHSSSGLAMPCTVSQDDKSWIADSGASQHMTFNSSIFENYKRFAVPEVVNAAGGQKLVAYGCGQVNVKTLVAGKWLENHLTDVWYVPDLKYQLFSVSHALTKGLNVVFKNQFCLVKNGNQTIAIGQKSENGLFLMEMLAKNPRKPATVLISSSSDTLQVMHERMVHQNKKHCIEFLKRQGISLSNVNSEFCVGCVYGKAHKKSFHSRVVRPTKPAEQINADVVGPMEEVSVGGSRFMLVLKDDYTKFRRVFFLKAKSEVPNCIETFLNEAKTAGHTVKQILCDSGTEFINHSVKKILNDRGIDLRVAMVETPEQNGAAERENRTIVEAARAMVHQKELPKKLWAEACNTAVYVLNHTGPTSVQDKTPYELWHGKSENFNIKRLRIFGTKCYVHEPKQRRKKWDKKSVEGLFVGYEAYDGYRVFIPSKNKVERSCNLIFCDELPYDPLTVEVASCSDMCSVEENGSIQVNDDEDKCQQEPDPGRRYPERKHQKPQFLSENYVLFVSTLTGIETPTCYSDAIKSPESKLWEEAMIEELESHEENGTWKLTELPENQRILDNKWVYRIKTNTDGSPCKAKARLVARGFSQKAGYDYDDLFAPVARFDTLRTILSVAASQKLYLHQFDVKTAFLYGTLDKEIYMKQPEGFDDGSGRVCRLVRSLYGLKQAPRCWNRRFVQAIQKLQFQQSHADPCLFTKRSESSVLIVALYVDDGLVAGSSVSEIEKLVFNLKQEFKITDGPLGSFLGVQIHQGDNGDIFICQKLYTEKILQRFRLENSKPFSTPCDVAKSQEGDTAMVDVPFREAVGCLQYLSVATRPDIAFAVALVSRALCKPTTDDWKRVKRIYRYLRGTSDVGLLYRSNVQTTFSVFSDADHAGDEKTRRSTSGMVSINSCAAITWWSRLQHSVAISSTEAEYVAASEAANELVWLKLLFKELIEYDGTPSMYVDNQSAIKLAQNPQHHRRSKHIDVRFHSIREKVERGVLKLEYVPSSEQTADILTKPLTSVVFMNLRDGLGLVKS